MSAAIAGKASRHADVVRRNLFIESHPQSVQILPHRACWGCDTWVTSGLFWAGQGADNHGERGAARARAPIASYLPSFQMSVASCQSVPTFSQTTTYFPVTSCFGPFVFKLNVPISRAAEVT